MRRRKIVDISILAFYIALIYSTLSIAPRLVLRLIKIFGHRRLGLIADIAVVSAPLAFLSIFYYKLKRRRLGVYFGLMTILSIYVLLLIFYTPIIAEKIHLIEYGFLSYLSLRVFKDSRSRDAAYSYVISILILVGYLDELIQKFLPNRVYELRDVGLNILSGLLGLALIRLLG